jgi:ubiquinone/menaquinone biosynthesis C-methylase UbiE
MSASSTFVATSGDGYELVMGRWSRRLAEPFVDFAGLGDDDTVLDAGCGTGSLSFAMARRMQAGRIEGVDLSRAYINHARSLNTDPRVRFAEGDVSALLHKDASFDRVLSLLVLHFVPRTAEAVAELKRVARPGATVAAAVWDARGGLVANRIFYDTAAALDPAADARRAKNYTRPMTRPGELTAAWREAGFIDVREAALTIRMEFESFDDYWKPYTGKDGPGAEYVGTLTDDRRRVLENALRAAYLDGEDDGPRSYAAVAWAVAGTVPD